MDNLLHRAYAATLEALAPTACCDECRLAPGSPPRREAARIVRALWPMLAAATTVRTVGDLTARHMSKHATVCMNGVGGVPRTGPLKVVTLRTQGLVSVIWGDWWIDAPLDTPCEVLS